MIRLTAIQKVSHKWPTVVAFHTATVTPVANTCRIRCLSTVTDGPSGGGSSASSWPTPGVDPQIQSEVLERCAELHSSIMSLNEKVRYSRRFGVVTNDLSTATHFCVLTL